MYHLIVLAAVRETVEALDEARLPTGEATRERIGAMTRFGAALLGADGEPLPLGDSVPGEGPVPEEVRALPVDGRRLVRFAETGYAALRSADGRDRLVLDVGDTCPDELPAHAHADALSFVLERDGCPLIVDPGVGEYAPGPWRAYARSTRAHSTIEIDGEDQSEVWGSFRVARRARALAVREGSAAGDVWMEGGHDGYRRLPCRAVHRRRVVSRAGGGFTILDRVRARRPCALRSFVHLAAGLEVEVDAEGARIRRDGETVATLRWRGYEGAETVSGSTRPVQGWVFPGFGQRLPAPVLVLRGRCSGETDLRLEIDP
jgi:hypothetical protein